MRITPPPMGMLVDAEGGDVPVAIEDDRLTAAFPLEVGAERTLRFRTVVPRDAGGLTLSAGLHVADYKAGAEHRVWSSHEVGTRLSGGGIDVGAFRIAPAGLVVLSILALWLLGMAVAKAAGMRDAGGAVTMIAIAVGFWALFAAMAWRDWRSLHAWTETTCTVLARRLDASTFSSTGRARLIEPSHNRDEVYRPVLALRYEVEGREAVSTGFDTASRLAIGGLGGAVRSIDPWTPGSKVRCWVDPAEPRDVVVPGFGGAYLFATFPLPIFLFGAWRLRAGRTR